MLVLLLDGLNMIRRIHAAQPADSAARVDVQTLERSVDGSIRRVLTTFQPTHAAFVLDGAGRNWRQQIYPAYKTNRPPMPKGLADGVEMLARHIDADAMPVISLAGFEADDVIASVAVRVTAAGGDVVVVSTDTGYCQLLRPGLRVFDHFAERWLDAAFVQQRFGVQPQSLSSWLALVGLASSGIGGVKGIGAKTATALISRYGDLKALLEHRDEVAGRPGRLLREQTDAARQALELVSLKCDVEVGRNLNQLRVKMR